MNFEADYRMLVDGKLVDGAGRIDVYNPATGEAFASAPAPVSFVPDIASIQGVVDDLTRLARGAPAHDLPRARNLQNGVRRQGDGDLVVYARQFQASTYPGQGDVVIGPLDFDAAALARNGPLVTLAGDFDQVRTQIDAADLGRQGSESHEGERGERREQHGEVRYGLA